MITPVKNLRWKIKIQLTLLFLFILVTNARSNNINITVQDFMFTPSSVTVTVGDTITWTWLGSRNHTTTCDGVFPGTSLPSGAAPWNAPLNSGTPVFEYIISVAGTYNYVCEFHAPSMAGTITAETTLPVELTDFVATTIKNEVILDWATTGEINNDRFEVQRVNLDKASDMDPKDLPYITIGTLRGYGNSNQGHDYKFIDRNLSSGTYSYRLKQVDFNSNFIFHLLNEEIVIDVPKKFTLSQNYPNPFNPTTRINYEIPENGYVTVSLINIEGKELVTLVNEFQNGGYQGIDFNGSNLSSGIYYYKIDYTNSGNRVSKIKKMMLIK